jgi:hypothetical protein
VPFALRVETLTGEAVVQENACEVLHASRSFVSRASNYLGLSAQDKVNKGSVIDFHLGPGAALFYARHEKVPNSS